MATSLLLADDSPTIAKILTLALANDDYTIKSVTNASDALTELQQNPQIFLVDISLPDKDAFEFAKEIRSKKATADIKIIFLANSFDPVDELACKNAGADAIVMKPFDPSELRRKLKEVLTSSVNLGAKPAENVTIPTAAPTKAAPALPPVPKAAVVAPVDSPVKPTVVAEEKLSEAAEELAAFFEGEIVVNQTTGPAEFKIEDSVPEHDTEDAVAVKSGDVLDLSSALLDWTPAPEAATKEPAKAALSQWSTKAPIKNAAMFDTGGSSFKFSPDYVSRISKAFDMADSLEQELSGAEQFNPERSNFGAETDANAVKELHQLLEVNKAAKEAPAQIPQKAAYSTDAAVRSPLSRNELEEIVRDEVRIVCKSLIEKIAWEVIPELAENVIRKELDKVLKELDSNS
jgi:CheY-like chemotaxis protein